MNDRDTLATELFRHWHPDVTTGELADAVINLGWRPPPRVITEAEANQLLPGSVIRRNGKAFEREHCLWWHGGVREGYAVLGGSGPITVLHDPAEEAGHG